MSPHRLFRGLILGEVALFLLMVVLGSGFEHDPTAPPGFSVRSPDPAWVNIVGVVWLITWIAALVGLWRLRPWGRRAYLAVLIAFLALGLTRLPEPVSPRDVFYASAIWFISGLLVALMYFSPVASTFEAPSPAA